VLIHTVISVLHTQRNYIKPKLKPGFELPDNRKPGFVPHNATWVCKPYLAGMIIEGIYCSEQIAKIS